MYFVSSGVSHKVEIVLKPHSIARPRETQKLQSTWHTLLPLIPAFFRCKTREIAIAGASMPPIGRDLENPSLTSGGQTVTLVKKFTETLRHNFWWAFECRLSQLSSSIGYEDNRGKCLFLANFEFLKCDFADSKFEPQIHKKKIFLWLSYPKAKKYTTPFFRKNISSYIPLVWPSLMYSGSSGTWIQNMFRINLQNISKNKHM